MTFLMLDYILLTYTIPRYDDLSSTEVLMPTVMHNRVVLFRMSDNRPCVRAELSVLASAFHDAKKLGEFCNYDVQLCK